MHFSRFSSSDDSILGSLRSLGLGDNFFNLLVLDEAGHSFEAETLVPMTIAK